MKIAAWLVAACALMVAAHWWPPAYALAALAALEALVAHERKPARRRWRDSGSARRGWINGR